MTKFWEVLETTNLFKNRLTARFLKKADAILFRNMLQRTYFDREYEIRETMREYL